MLCGVEGILWELVPAPTPHCTPKRLLAWVQWLRCNFTSGMLKPGVSLAPGAFRGVLGKEPSVRWRTGTSGDK